MAQKANILIVDDEPNTLASLSRAFRLAGYDATVCDSALKALALAKTQNVDLIFSDVVMPGKDGLSFLEDLRAQGIAVPVVMMSGQAHIEMAVAPHGLALSIFWKNQFPRTNCCSRSRTCSSCGAWNRKTCSFVNAWENMKSSGCRRSCAKLWRRLSAWRPASLASAFWERRALAKN